MFRMSQRRRLFRPALIAATLVAAVLVPVAPAAATTSGTTVVAFGSSGWSYYRAKAAPPANWRTTVQKWRSGKAPLGFGHSTGPLGTKVPNVFTGKKPLATYFQKTFTLKQVPSQGITITTWADDGVAVFVNGKEVLRSNLPTYGPKHDSYWAMNAPQSLRARTKLVTATIPASALKVGANVVAAHVQSNWRETHNVTFDAKLVTAKPVATPTPPVVSNPSPAPVPPADPAPAPAPEAPQEETDPATPTPDGWALAWADEFDDTVVDTTKWKVFNNSTFGDGNNELACLMAGNVTEGGGTLTIRAEKLTAPKLCGTNDGRFPEGRSYTSGFLETRGLASFTHGRYEIRFKAPIEPGTSKGLWPAFWLRPASGSIGELDVLEIIGSSTSNAAQANKLMHTIHYDYSGTHGKQGGSYTLPSGTWQSGFHTAAVEWEPGAMRWYVDGVLTYQRTLATTPWLDEAFGRPFYLRLNMAVGGNWPGSPDAATTFPADYVVDYVRVYQRPPAPAPTVASVAVSTPE
jgi:beta-glucanase (GH16 family)